MKALVSGIDGFVGPYLVKELLSRKYSVAGTYWSKDPGLVLAYQADVTDRQRVIEIFKYVRPDVVFHLAGVSDVQYSFDHPKLTEKINVNGTHNMLDAAAFIKKKLTFIHVGSATQYGKPVYLPIDEKHPTDPVSPYAKSKLVAEGIALKFSKHFKVICVRSFNHLGPGQSSSFVASSFAEQIAQIEAGKKQLIKVGDLSAKRDFTDVRDVVKAYALLSAKGRNAQIYNVCSGREIMISDLLDKLASLSKKKIRIVKSESRMRPGDVSAFYGSYDKLKAATGWTPRIPLKESLEGLLDYWRDAAKNN